MPAWREHAERSPPQPGDIVKSMSGQTIEVLNTDAEGRLILCDAITYCAALKPEVVIDLATLTGACAIALGNHLSGLFSNDQELAAELKAAGDRADDRAWHDADRRGVRRGAEEQLRGHGDVAPGREAAAITAACFLAKFTDGLALGAPSRHRRHSVNAGGPHKGSTGSPAPLLVDYLINKGEGGGGNCSIMSRVDFYVLSADALDARLRYACRLAERAVEHGCSGVYPDA